MWKKIVFFNLISIISILCVFAVFFYIIQFKNSDDKRIITSLPKYIAFTSQEIEVIDVINGEMTGYAPNCKGCKGTVGCPPYPNVTNGNIYYNDKEFGKIRIVAADESIKCGTIVRITANKLYDEPFLAIVLDRGFKIKGNIFDLLFEENVDINTLVGRQHNVQFEILRRGWQ